MTGMKHHKNADARKRKYPKKTDGGQVKVLGAQFEHSGPVFDKLGRQVNKGAKK
jgi:hypothetical protein